MRKLLMVCGILMLAAIPASAQDKYPSAEIFAGYSYANIDFTRGLSPRLSAHGFGMSIAGNFGSRLGGVADFSYQRKNGVNFYTYIFGPQISVRGKAATGFAHVLLGGSSESKGGISANGFTLGLGGGVDVNAGKHIAVRLGQFDYLPHRFFGTWIHNFRYEAGVVFKIGEQ